MASPEKDLTWRRPLLAAPGGCDHSLVMVVVAVRAPVQLWTLGKLFYLYLLTWDENYIFEDDDDDKNAAGGVFIS